MAGRREFARFLIDLECDYSIRILISDQQEAPCWINGKTSGELALCGFNVYIRELACVLIDLKDHDAVMAAIGAIEEPS